MDGNDGPCGVIVVHKTVTLSPKHARGFAIPRVTTISFGRNFCSEIWLDNTMAFFAFSG